MSEGTRFITNEELRERYGEEGVDFSITPLDGSVPMAKVHYCKGTTPLTSIDLVFATKFSTQLYIYGHNKTFDPTRPASVATNTRNGYRIESSTYLGCYRKNDHELELTVSEPKAMLKTFVLSRSDGSDIPLALKKKIVVNGGKARYVITKLRNGGKAMEVYVMADTEKKLEDLTIELEA